METAAKTNDDLTPHVPEEGTEDNRRRHVDWTAGAFLLLMGAIAVPVLELLEFVLSLLVRLSAFC
jgi:hypothetical protein